MTFPRPLMTTIQRFSGGIFFSPQFIPAFYPILFKFAFLSPKVETKMTIEQLKELQARRNALRRYL